jgi:hypothetical protein
MRAKFLSTLYSMAVGSILALLWNSGIQQPTVRASGESTPFTAHAVTILFDSNGLVDSSLQESFAVRGNGSYAERRTGVDHTNHRVSVEFVIRDARTGRKTIVYPRPRLVTSVRFDPEALTPQECTGAILSAPEAGRFLGLRVVEESGRGEDGIQRRRLFAPELNCLMVYRESKIVDSDGEVVQTNLYQVTALRLGEPDPTYFTVPKTVPDTR